MPQFDILTLSSQIFSLLISLYLLYYFSVTNMVLYYTEIKKYRAKKMAKDVLTVKNTQTNLNYSFWLIQNCYKTFL